MTEPEGAWGAVLETMSWVGLVPGIPLLIFGWMMDRMAQDSRSERAGALHRILCDFTIRGSVQKQVHLQPLPMHLQASQHHYCTATVEFCGNCMGVLYT